MKTFIQIVTLGLMMTFSVATTNAAKAKQDRTKAPETKTADKVKKTKKNVKDGGAEHEVSWGTNARSAKNKAKAIDHNASRSNTTASKTQPKPGSKKGKKEKAKDSKKN